MEQSVIILGAKGRFGRAAIEAFKDKGWRVSVFARHWEWDEKAPSIRYICGDALNLESLTQACADHAVIVNALNPQYEDWEDMLPTITKNVISAGTAAKATIMIPANIYNYGDKPPAMISEKTPHIANTKKGRLRIEMEKTYKAACTNGLRTILLRGGDFFEGKNTGNWFETYITDKIDRGIVTYPGPLNVIHSWAYLPDMARAMVELAERRHKLNGFEEFGFRGYAVTGKELVQALEHACNRKLFTKKFPWLVARLMALFSRQIHEVLEMRYLWQEPHEINAQKLLRFLPDFQTTPFQTAVDLAINRMSRQDPDIANESLMEPVNT